MPSYNQTVPSLSYILVVCKPSLSSWGVHTSILAGVFLAQYLLCAVRINSNERQ
jgi:hypothetical protein